MSENLYYEFADSLKDMLSKQFDHEVDLQKIPKNNGLECLSLVATQADGSHLTISIDAFYREYMKGEKIELICNTIHELFEKYSDMGNIPFTDFGKVSERIFLKLVNAEKNKAALQNMPHRLYHDLAVTYYLLLEDETDANTMAKITNGLLSAWNIDEKDLYELALRNAQKHLKHVIESMDMVLGKFINDSHSCGGDICDTQGNNPLNLMYVVSNSKKWFGAAVILYDNVLEEIASMFQHDFFILPASVHEVIVLPADPDVLDGQDLIQMVRCVNESEVMEDEILSDNVYLYHKEDKFMEMISCDN